MSKIEVNQISSQCGSTLTIGQSGDTVTLACGATQTGFGRTGTVDWDTTAKTTNFTAVSGNGYFVNTTSGAITVTLPATPSAGDIVAVKDYANTADTNKITIERNGSNIDGGTNNPSIANEGGSVTLIYVDATKGWLVTDAAQKSDLTFPEFIVATGGTVTCCGDYKIHTFTSPGTFTVCSAGNPAGSTTVDYLVVAGGGGGGQGYYGGGGGAGGLRASATTYAIGCNPAGPLVNCVSALPVTATGYPITVGAGGAGAPGTPCNTAKGGNGSNSVFSTITSTSGGGGGSRYSNPHGGNPGGSGGGGADNGYAPFYGLGNTPPVSPPQGNDGGGPFGGGGGGAKAAGGTIPSQPYGGAGGAGAGFTNGAFGSGNGECSSCVQYFSGGGGGGGGSLVGDNGGIGGGGQGGNRSGCAPTPQIRTAGTANTGGGGGAGGDNYDSGGAGGSGIVVIRYRYQ